MAAHSILAAAHVPSAQVTDTYPYRLNPITDAKWTQRTSYLLEELLQLPSVDPDGAVCADDTCTAAELGPNAYDKGTLTCVESWLAPGNLRCCNPPVRIG